MPVDLIGRLDRGVAQAELTSSKRLSLRRIIRNGSNAEMFSYTEFHGANLFHAEFHDATLFSAEFHDANLYLAKFPDADLDYESLSGAILIALFVFVLGRRVAR